MSMDHLRSLIEVALTNGNRVIKSDAAHGTGPSLNFPVGVAIDSANGRALVANNSTNTIIAVDLATGNRTVFSSTGDPMAIPPIPVVGRGPSLDLANGIALDGRGNAFVIGQKLWAVELVSGDRVIVGD